MMATFFRGLSSQTRKPHIRHGKGWHHDLHDAHITLENVIQVKTILWMYAEEKSIKLRCVDCA